MRGVRLEPGNLDGNCYGGRDRPELLHEKRQEGEEGLVMDWEWGLRKRRIKTRYSVSSSYVWADSGIMS